MEKAARKLLLTFIYRLVDRAFISQANKRYFEWVSLRPDQLTYAPHAVDNEFFMREDETRNELALQKRTELGIPTDATVFLFVGKLEPKKQPNMLAEAFQAAGLCNSHLVFIGSGILETKLKVQCASTENIHFVGFQNQRSMLFGTELEMSCASSKGPNETWGLVVNEAMASGCATILSDRVGCQEDILSSDAVGIRFSADQTDELSLHLNLRLSTNAKHQKHQSVVFP